MSRVQVPHGPPGTQQTTQIRKGDQEKMARYNIYEDGKGKVIVVSHYAGRSVKGIAKCSPHDTYDQAAGVELARARCDLKIAEKKLENAQFKRAALEQILSDVMEAVNEIRMYTEECEQGLLQAKENLDKQLAALK